MKITLVILLFLQLGISENTSIAASNNSGAQLAVEKAARQVYRVLVETSDGSILGGSAFLVSGARVIATNHHVIQDGVTFQIGMTDPDGKVRSIPAHIVASYPQKDLALIQALDDLPGQPLALDGQYPGLAQELFAIGYPAAADIQDAIGTASFGDPMFFAPSVLKGYVSRVLTNRWFRNQLQHQTPIIPGYSGGPLINPDGAVVGVSTSIHKKASGVSYAVLAADLIDLLNACALPATVASPSPHLAAAQIAETQPQAAPAPKKDALLRTSLSFEAGDGLIDRAYNLLDNGDIVAARLMFEYLRNHLEMADIYMGLAKTYDPEFLREKGILGIKGNEKTAQRYYHLASTLLRKRELPAQNRHSNVRNGPCSNSYCELVDGVNGPYLSCNKVN
ncbi:MAG: serine protease [Hyphomicrobiales bacterium]|nr:serine protease [Hyphomicrobiales bacterium]